MSVCLSVCLKVRVSARESCLRFSVHEMCPGQGVMLPHCCCMHFLCNVHISHLLLAYISWTFFGMYRLLDMHSNTVTLCCIPGNIVCACVCMCICEAVTMDKILRLVTWEGLVSCKPWTHAPLLIKNWSDDGCHNNPSVLMPSLLLSSMGASNSLHSGGTASAIIRWLAQNLCKWNPPHFKRAVSSCCSLNASSVVLAPHKASST